MFWILVKTVALEYNGELLEGFEQRGEQRDNLNHFLKGLLYLPVGKESVKRGA